MGCPKCKSANVWIEDEGVGTWLRCKTCGLMKLVKEVKDGYIIHHRLETDQITLPRTGSKLHKILMIIAAFDDIQTSEIAHIVKDSTNIVASNIVILETNGLVDRVEDRRGVEGGSLWALTLTAKNLLGE